MLFLFRHLKNSENTNIETDKFYKLKSFCLLNSAAALLKLEKHREAVTLCDEVGIIINIYHCFMFKQTL